MADGDSLYFDAEGNFRSPELAALHAIVEQGGFSTPVREAARMIRDGGRHAEIARAWMAEKGLADTDLDLERS